jgi:hypothetical protein
VIVLLTTAFLAYRVAIVVSTLATLSFNAALLLIPLAIVAIVAGVVVLYNKWSWFHDAVNNTFNWIKTHWQLLAAILGGPFVAAAIIIIRNFGKIKAAVSSVWGTVRSVFGRVKGFLSHAFTFDFVAGIGRGIADWLNAHTPFGDKISAGPIHFTLPALAEGGTITRAGAALVGERGPEIVSLPNAAQVVPNAAVADAMGPQTIVTQVYLDKRQIAEAVGTYAADRIARR